MTETYWVQVWSCPACDTAIEGTESDTRTHLANQIGGTVDYTKKEYENSLVCKCGSHMECEWEDRDEAWEGS